MRKKNQVLNMEVLLWRGFQIFLWVQYLWLVNLHPPKRNKGLLAGLRETNG